MNDSRVVCSYRLTCTNNETGKTRHFFGNDLAAIPSELRIVSFANDDGVYLLYFDGEGNEITDTYHENVEMAKSQAKWEFNVRESDWQSDIDT